MQQHVTKLKKVKIQMSSQNIITQTRLNNTNEATENNWEDSRITHHVCTVSGKESFHDQLVTVSASEV